MERWSRREFVRFATVGTVAGTAGCSALRPNSTENGSSTTGNDRQTQRSGPVSGRVVGLGGDGIADATIEALVPSRGSVAETTTDQQGRFEIRDLSSPVWLRATASTFIPRTVAVAPDASRRIPLTPRDGTVSLRFGGDVMFGRRFYENDDPLEPHAQIQPNERRASHDAILRYISPLLADADITSVNLETPLTTTAWRHPSKRYIFVSHPDAAPAMAQAGIDYVTLGNNHTFDALTPGLDDTLQALGSAGIESSGAGRSSDEAWEPAYFEEQGLTIGLVSCTTVTGERYDIDWAADSGQSETHTVTSDEVGGTTDTETLTFSGGIGVASATDERLSDAVTQAGANADVVVVQIHGGDEYRREPTERIEQLTETAISAGADVVVNHHPHVTGGLELRDGALVAWTLGNLVFDQEIWPAFPSYTLTVHVTDEGVARAYVDPLLIEGYVPKGVVGKPRTWQLRGTAELSSDRFSLADSMLEYVSDSDSMTRTTTRIVDGDGTIYTRESGWVSRIVDGASSVELGRDLLPTGTFDNPDIDDERYEGPLWRFSRGADSNGPEFGYDGSGGIQLSRTAGNTQRSILTTTERVPLAGSMTLLSRYRLETDSRLELLVRWYESTNSPPVDSISVDLGRTTGWERLERSLEIPAKANYIRFYFRLYPPDGGDERVAHIDDIRLIEWTGAETTGGKAYDHLRLRDSATIEFTTSSQRDVSWVELE
jgi:poly-gamma-glutamate capsule biosynthesis protein CapA/YwtB (metallophosphatase superfamily)